MALTRKRHCAPGKILRASYRQRRGDREIYVPASCITDRGLPGKGFKGDGKGIGPLKKNMLGQFGYHDAVHMTAAARHRSLRRAVRAYGATSVGRMLNAIAVYNKNTAPASAARFNVDRKWVRRTFKKSA
jgi:hypothetical protein